MNIRQVAKYLRISPSTVRRMLTKGSIEGTKTVMGWEFTQEQVNNYLKKYE